jgi:hypothetical protein
MKTLVVLDERLIRYLLLLTLSPIAEGPEELRAEAERQLKAALAVLQQARKEPES